MNPVFVFLVLLCAAALWFLLSFLFRPIGKLFSKIWQDAVDILPVARKKRCGRDLEREQNK